MKIGKSERLTCPENLWYKSAGGKFEWSPLVSDLLLQVPLNDLPSPRFMELLGDVNFVTPQQENYREGSFVIEPKTTVEERVGAIRSLYEVEAGSGKLSRPDREFCNQGLRALSENFIDAACVLTEIQYLANPQHMEEFDTNYKSMCEFLFFLGQLIDIDSKWSEVPLFSCWQLKRGDGEAMRRGLIFARYGDDADRSFNNNINSVNSVNRYVKIYQRIRQSVRREQKSSSKKITRDVFKETLVKQATMLDAETEKAVFDILGYRAAELLYSFLELPSWISDFFAVENDQQRIKTVESIGRYSFKQLWVEFSEPEKRREYVFTETSPPDNFKDLNQKDKKWFLESLKKFLVEFRLADGQVNTFKQWFEDPNSFLDLEFVKSFKRYVEEGEEWQDDFLWQGVLVPGKAGFKEVTEWYEAKIRSTEEGDESLEAYIYDYARFQRTAIKMTCSFLKIYSGWEDGNEIETNESFPRNIIRDKLLNCVGRSMLVGKCATRLGFSPDEVLSAISLNHVSMFLIFKDGYITRLEPTFYSGYELFKVDEDESVTKRSIKQSLEHKGFIETIKVGGEYYMASYFDRAIGSSLLFNYLSRIDANSQYHLKGMELVIGLLPTVNVLINGYYPLAAKFFNKYGHLSQESLVDLFSVSGLSNIIGLMVMVRPDIDKLIGEAERKDPDLAELIRLGVKLTFEDSMSKEEVEKTTTD